MLSPTLSQMTNQELSEAIRYMQNELHMRSENELSEKYNELIQAIKDRKWENALELRQQIEKLGLQLGLKEDVCQPVLTELKNAIKYLFKNEKYVSEKTKRQIFEFCEQTTLFQAAMALLRNSSEQRSCLDGTAI